MTVLIFVHGLANGPAYRRGLHDIMAKKLADSICAGTFTALRVAQWRSRGSWHADIADLGHPDGVRAEEAVTDVLPVVIGNAGERLVIIGHSMGSLLALLAMGRTEPSRVRAALVTVGSPLGNPVLAAGIYTQAWSRRLEQPCPVPWVDVWNREDPICADILMGHRDPVNCPRSVQVTAPGHPSVADPAAEHGAYFDLPAFWQVVKEAAEGIE
jgi:pimeloyl-ACP methyl ester carboxylesterase